MAGFIMLALMFGLVFVFAVFAKPIIAVISILTGDKEGLYESNLCEGKYYKSLFSKYQNDYPVRHNSYNWKDQDRNEYDWRNKGEGNMN
ncbi:hypothetical protein C4565_00750 [Candidatus Parcubacteria bacterium]|nr:MAG: hypothetical protein C4565_00750 [Candidatus Parcubacteria bacterium]